MGSRLRERVLGKAWGPAVVHAGPISFSILALFYHWFGVADRYAIFLYGHTAPGIPGARPFDAMTRSRYWMAGLVAAGGVMVGYAALNWTLGRIGRGYRPPAWWRVWAVCAGPLAVGIPAITMTVNAPTLPAGLAVACAAATLAGLALALAPGGWAARRPIDLAWLAADGAGLMPTLLLLRAVELPARGLSVSVPLAWGLAIGGTLAGAAWLGVVTLLRLWRKRPAPGAGVLLASGLGISYLLMPLVHHACATPPGYRYITDAANFFAYHWQLQALTLVLAAGLALGVTRLRRLDVLTPPID